MSWCLQLSHLFHCAQRNFADNSLALLQILSPWSGGFAILHPAGCIPLLGICHAVWHDPCFGLLEELDYMGCTLSKLGFLACFASCVVHLPIYSIARAALVYLVPAARSFWDGNWLPVPRLHEILIL